MALLMVGALPMIPHTVSFCSPVSSSQSEALGIGLRHSVPSLSVSAASSPPSLFVYCGRGDRKTAKGKRFNHSFGNARPRNKKKGRGPPRLAVPPSPSPSPSPSKKDRVDDDGLVKIEIDESLFSG